MTTHHRKIIQTLSAIAAFGGPFTLPIILTIRYEHLVAPNEEPKWLIFVILGLILAISGSWLAHLKTLHQQPKHDPHEGITLVGLLFVLFFLGLALGCAYSINQTESLIRLSFWMSFAAVFLASKETAKRGLSYLNAFKVAINLGGFLLSSWFWFDFFLRFGQTDFDQFTRFSRIGHFNFTGDVLVILIPLLFWVSISTHQALLRLTAMYGLATGAFMMVSSGSLGGIGGLLGGGVLVVAVWAMTIKKSSKTKGSDPFFSTKRTLIAFTAIGLLLLMGGPLLDHLPKEYKDQLLTRASWSQSPTMEMMAPSKELPPLASFWIMVSPYLGARTPMWASTSGMILDHPWIGSGTGSYLTEYPNYEKRYDLFADFEVQGHRVKTNPHNLFLQIASENGIPLAFMFLVLYIWLTVAVLKQALKNPSSLWLCGLWALLAAGLDAQVNHVFFNPASLFIAALTGGTLVGLLPKNNEKLSEPLTSLFRSRLTSILISLAALYLATVPIRAIVSDYYLTKAEDQNLQQPPLSPRQILLTLEESLQWQGDNIRSLYALALMQSRLGQIDKAIQTLQMLIQKAPYHTASLNLLGSLHLRLIHLDESQKLFEEAQRIDPDDHTSKENLALIEKMRVSSSSDPHP